MVRPAGGKYGNDPAKDTPRLEKLAGQRTARCPVWHKAAVNCRIHNRVKTQPHNLADGEEKFWVSRAIARGMMMMISRTDGATLLASARNQSKGRAKRVQVLRVKKGPLSRQTTTH